MDAIIEFSGWQRIVVPTVNKSSATKYCSTEKFCLLLLKQQTAKCTQWHARVSERWSRYHHWKDNNIPLEVVQGVYGHRRRVVKPAEAFNRLSQAFQVESSRETGCINHRPEHVRSIDS